MPRILITLLVLGAGLLVGRTAEARYRPLTLNDLLGNSDLVLVGEITTLEDETYTLTISETLAGKYKGPTIVIQRFKDWACASRWAPYATGQKLVVCLKKVVDPQSCTVTWRVRSGGGEGELPIVADRAHFRGRGADDIPIDVCTVHGNEARFRRFTLESIRALVEKLRQPPADPRQPHSHPAR